jgi:hypothetical protein
MSALGQKATFASQNVMSALPPKVDMCSATSDVRFGPIADMVQSVDQTGMPPGLKTGFRVTESQRCSSLLAQFEAASPSAGREKTAKNPHAFGLDRVRRGVLPTTDCLGASCRCSQAVSVAVFESCQSAHHFLQVRNTVRVRKNAAVRHSHFAIRRPAAGCSRSPPSMNARLGKPRLSSLKKSKSNKPLPAPPRDDYPLWDVRSVKYQS